MDNLAIVQWYLNAQLFGDSQKVSSGKPSVSPTHVP